MMLEKGLEEGTASRQEGLVEYWLSLLAPPPRSVCHRGCRWLPERLALIAVCCLPGWARTVYF